MPVTGFRVQPPSGDGHSNAPILQSCRSRTCSAGRHPMPAIGPQFNQPTRRSRPISDIHNPTNEVTNQTVAGCCDKSGSGMVIPVIRSLDWLDSGSRSVPMSQGPTGVQDSADRGPVPQKPPLYCPRWLQEVGVPPNSLRTFSADAQRTTAPQRNGSAAKRQVTGRQPLHRTEVMGQRVRPRAARPPTSPRRHGRPKRARLGRTR